MPSKTTLLVNCRAATMTGAGFGLLEDAAVLIAGDSIDWVGPRAKAPGAHRQHDLGGRLLTPALIDCHTHLVHGGNRAGEFEARLLGASYEQIARVGGGILATVAATRAASESDLLAAALPRVDALIAEGVATVEIKSGYGLAQDAELKMLRVARQIAAQRPVTVRTSFLAAHAVPPEYAGRADAYIDAVCIPALHAAHAQGLVDAVDGFCETIAFSPAQIDRLFAAARGLGLPVKLHAEQLSNLGGAALAARHGALSADHLEWLDAAGVAAAAAAGADPVYGVNTGFGKLASLRIAPADTATLQRNLIRSHCCGVGAPISRPHARLMMALKLLSLGRGAGATSTASWPRCALWKPMKRCWCNRAARWRWCAPTRTRRAC